MSLFAMISEKTPTAALPDSERTKASGKMSAGILILFRTPEKIPATDSIAPDARNIAIATIIATKDGIIFLLTFIPSLAPSIKASYTGIFLIIATVKIMRIIPGRVHREIKSIISGSSTSSCRWCEKSYYIW